MTRVPACFTTVANTPPCLNIFNDIIDNLLLVLNPHKASDTDKIKQIIMKPFKQEYYLIYGHEPV